LRKYRTFDSVISTQHLCQKLLKSDNSKVNANNVDYLFRQSVLHTLHRLHETQFAMLKQRLRNILKYIVQNKIKLKYAALVMMSTSR